VSPIFQSVDLSNQLYDAEQDHLHDDLAPLATAEDRAQRTHDLLMQCVDASDDERERLHEEIVIINVEVAESIVMRYRNRGVPVDDLVQVACLGLVKAARGFDPTKSDNFLGYAVPTILGEVKRFFRDNAWAVRPPRRIQELQAEIAAASAQLMQDTGRVPTPADVAEVLEIDVKEVVEALSADGCFAPTSLDRPPREDESTPLAETLGAEDPGYAHAEAVVALRPLCENLTERERRIVYLRFFHEWTQARIAEEFGVTQMQVSRLLTRIFAKLREQLGSLDAIDIGPAQRRAGASALDAAAAPVA
jgi:RNA polymerase sigma-70 factor (sigma-B/F/G subfamily)